MTKEEEELRKTMAKEEKHTNFSVYVAREAHTSWHISLPSYSI
jgi:hypothetical protein